MRTVSAALSYSMRSPFALDELVEAVALLPEKRQLAGLGREDAELVALRVLTHFKPRTAHEDGALGDRHLPGEDGDLLQVVMAQGIGIDRHGLVAVGFFGQRQSARQSQCDEQKSMW